MISYKFEDIVRDFLNDGMSVSDAIRKAVDKFPKAHEQFLDRLRQGEKIQLSAEGLRKGV